MTANPYERGHDIAFAQLQPLIADGELDDAAAMARGMISESCAYLASIKGSSVAAMFLENIARNLRNAEAAQMERGAHLN